MLRISNATVATEQTTELYASNEAVPTPRKRPRNALMRLLEALVRPYTMTVKMISPEKRAEILQKLHEDRIKRGGECVGNNETVERSVQAELRLTAELRDYFHGRM